MLALRDICLRFHDEGARLLDRVSLSVEPGECIGLTGPSGGGKTLIALVAAGVIPDIIHAGLIGSVDRVYTSGTRRTEAAIVFQDPAFQLLARTVRDELLFTPRTLGWDDGDVAGDMSRIAAGLDIGHLLDRNPRELSMGEVQRVAVAVALMQRPQLIVMDEPTQYIDRFHVEATLEFVMEETGRLGASVLLIEHNTHLLRRFCSRTHWVENGRIGPHEFSAEHYGAPLPSSRPESGVCLSARDVSYEYNAGRTVLNGVSLDIRAGENIAVLGPNGSGKSTLARLLCGLYKPRSGEISFRGRPRSANGGWFRHVGLVMQNPDRQLFASTVAEECAFGPRNFGVEPEVYGPRIAEGLGAFGMDGFEDRDPLTLSYGEKRRVGIIGIDAAEPEVLILDEPTSGLDHRSRLALLERMKHWNVRGRTCVVITHDIRFAFTACHRAVFMRDGAIVADTMLETMGESDVVSLYAGG